MNATKLLAAFAFLSVATQSQAQSSILLTNNGKGVPLAPNEIILMDVEPETNAKATIDVKNTSNSTKSYIAKRYDVILNADATSTAQAYFCIAGSCYGPPTILSPVALTLTSMQSASDLQGPFEMLIADLDEASTKGYSFIKYTFQNKADAADSVQISIKYNSTAVVTSLSSQSKAQLKLEVSPVPAKGIVTLKTNQLSASANITVTDAIGRLVYSTSISQSEAEKGFGIDLSTEHAGIYYLKVESQGKSTTRKFVLQ